MSIGIEDSESEWWYTEDEEIEDADLGEEAC